MPPDLDPPRASRVTPRAAVLASALLAALVYANALGNGFALDDEFVVQHNPAVRGFGDPGVLLLGPYWPGSHVLYRPLTLLTFAVDWALGGSATWMHAVNVLLHAGVAALVALLLLRLRASPAAALVAGAIFAVHPVHVEAVANLVGRSELLAALLSLAACVAYLARPRPKVGTAALAGLLYFLALCAKESALALPALLLVVDAVRTRDERIPALRLLRDNLAVLGACAIAFAGYLALRAVATGSALGAEPAPYLRGISTADRLATAVRLWPEYLRLLFWPRDLAAEWGPDLVRPVGWSHPLVWLGLALGVGIAIAAVRSWRGDRWIAAGVLWFALSVFPISQIPFPIGTLLAERTLYLPSIALAFLVPPLWSPPEREERIGRWAPIAAAVIVVVGGMRTWLRTPSWSSTRAVYDTLAAEHPESWWIDWRAGQLLTMAGRGGEAVPWYARARGKIGPGNLKLEVEYATLLMSLGGYGDAEPVLRGAMRNFPRSSTPGVLLASLLIQQGRYGDALPVLDAAARALEPGRSNVEVIDRRALAHDGMGRVDLALGERRVTLADPAFRAYPHTWYHFARLLAERGDTAGARAALDSARLRVPPGLRPAMTLDPLPPLTAPLMRGWRALPQPGPGAAP
ncbi:MAG TPA: hypothetical protein VF092_24755 [Longimicrobium sp.]